MKVVVSTLKIDSSHDANFIITCDTTGITTSLSVCLSVCLSVGL